MPQHSTYPVSPVRTGQSTAVQPVTNTNSNNVSSSGNDSQSEQNQNSQPQTGNQQKAFHLNSNLAPKKLTMQDLQTCSDRWVAETRQAWRQFWYQEQHTKIGHRLAYEVEQTRICARNGYDRLLENEHAGKVLPDLEKRSQRRKAKTDDPTTRMTPDELSEFRADHALPPTAEEIARNPIAEKHDAIQIEMIRKNPWNSHLFTHPEVEVVPQNTLWNRLSEGIKIKGDHQWEQMKTRIRHHFHHANDNRDHT